MKKNVDVSVWVFDDETSAADALKDLRQLQKDGIVKVMDAAVMVKDKNGKVSVKDTENVEPASGALFGLIEGGLIGLLGGVPGVIIGAVAGAGTGGVAAQLIDLGFPKEFLRNLQDSLQPGNSALVAMVEPTWIDRLVKELEREGGKLFKYTLEADLTDF
ncbi:MAG TPA: DUF1269 domain-containing protein [Anaerolineaceae bacterium]|nr:DUF1269 domain-containing protein [Anaerolineaceae bacterium]